MAYLKIVSLNKVELIIECNNFKSSDLYKLDEKEFCAKLTL